MIELQSRLPVLIPLLRAQAKTDDAAIPFLDAMSGGFVWNDERLHGLETYAMGCLRGIFRHRTSLIVQEPDLRFAAIWEELREKCPEWIGFSAERCSPNEALAAHYRKTRKKSLL